MSGSSMLHTSFIYTIQPLRPNWTTLHPTLHPFFTDYSYFWENY